MSYLFLTAGIGSPQLEEAGLRIIKQVSELQLFEKKILISKKDLSGDLGEYLKAVPKSDLNVSAKYGYFAWKPAIAKMAFDGYWGEFESVCYLDAGCEVIPSIWTRRSFQKYLEKSANRGVVVFHSSHPEKFYTTKQVFEKFPKVDSSDSTPQIQGGSWFLGNQLGNEVASSWYHSSQISYPLLTDVFDPEKEDDDFIAPRNDQSFFSLACKSYKISPEPIIPPGGGSGPRTLVRSLFFPFRWARNRSGESQTPTTLRIFGSISLSLYFYFSKFRNLRAI
jgi:hypothetical protein